MLENYYVFDLIEQHKPRVVTDTELSRIRKRLKEDKRVRMDKYKHLSDGLNGEFKNCVASQYNTLRQSSRGQW